MRIHHSQPANGFTIIPNATLQDQRLSTTARGVLVDLLSRPDGWQATADGMVEQAHRARPQNAEGRRAMRAAFAELEARGYLVRTVTRGAGGKMATIFDLYDRPQAADRGAGSGTSVATGRNTQSSSSHRSTGSGMSVATSENEHHPSSHRGTGSGTSIQREETKTDLNKEENDAGASFDSLNASALSMESGHADACPATAGAAARDDDRSAKPTRDRRTLDQRLDDHLAALHPDDVEEMWSDLSNDRMGITDWATKKARAALNLGWDSEPEDEPGGVFMRKAVGLVLMRLTKADGGGLTPYVEGLLGNFDWPDERWETAYKERKSHQPRPRTHYLSAKAPDQALSNLYAAVNDLGSDGRELMGAEFHARRPRIFKDCEAAAAKQLKREGADADPDELLALTIKYGQQHYSGNWPTFLVPEQLRPKPSAEAA